VIDCNDIARALGAQGLHLRGGFSPEEGDGIPAIAFPGRPAGTKARTLLLVGNIGPSFWPHFSAARSALGPGPDPLDRWTRQVVDPIAESFGAVALYPFGGPPWHPFQRWAERAEPVHVSPLLILIHPDYGLWHAYRAALVFADALDLKPRRARPSPCAACPDKPCLAACPVDAFTAGPSYDVSGCVGHVVGPSGRECREQGCRARRACPVGRSYAYPVDEMAFHMEAFLARRLKIDGSRNE
jgi:hypothetical protein